LIGVQVDGWLNAISKVQTWNLATIHGGIGIYVTGSSNRFSDNYLDCNNLRLEVRPFCLIILCCSAYWVQLCRTGLGASLIALI